MAPIKTKTQATGFVEENFLQIFPTTKCTDFFPIATLGLGAGIPAVAGGGLLLLRSFSLSEIRNIPSMKSAAPIPIKAKRPSGVRVEDVFLMNYFHN